MKMGSSAWTSFSESGLSSTDRGWSVDPLDSIEDMPLPSFRNFGIRIKRKEKESDSSIQELWGGAESPLDLIIWGPTKS